MDTHETTVRLLDLRERFDHARQGKPPNALGRAYAQLVAADASPGEEPDEAAELSLDDAPSDDGTDNLGAEVALD